MKHFLVTTILAASLGLGTAYAQTPPTGAPPANSNPVDDPVVAPHDQGNEVPNQGAPGPLTNKSGTGDPARNADANAQETDRFGGDNDPQMKPPQAK